MILSLLFIALVVVSIVFLVKTRYEDFHPIWSFLLGLALAVGMIGTIFCSIFIANVNIFRDADMAEVQEKRTTLVYQLENHTYENENNLGTVELMKEVAEFNGDVVGGRAKRSNPWTSWCTSTNWDYIEPIDLNEYNK